MMDNYATHKTPPVRAILADNPRFQVPFTPTSASWLNLVEVWLFIIESRADGVSVAKPNATLRAFTIGRNERCRPLA